MNPILKNVAMRILGGRVRSAYRIRAIAKARRLTILNLHRVSRDDGSSYKPLDPRVFEELLRYVTTNFTLTTFDALPETRVPSQSASGKPPLILSFDDGYKDFITVAAPILKKHGVRVNQNVIPGCVESGLPPLNVAIQDFVGKASESSLRELSIPGCELGSDLSNRLALGARVSQFLKNKPYLEQERYKALLFEKLSGVSGFSPTPMMTASDIRELLDEHEFGVHSFGHASMAHESDDFVRTDLRQCKEWFRSTFGRDVWVYAFPNGSYRDSHIAMAREAGYKHVLLVNEAFSSEQSTAHHRFTFYADSLREARFRATGCLKGLS